MESKTPPIYIVQAGDSLSSISRKLYGDFSKTDQIASMNKITNPNLIYPGQQLLVPNVPDAVTAEVITENSSAVTVTKKNYGKWVGIGFVIIAAILLAREARKQHKKNKSIK